MSTNLSVAGITTLLLAATLDAAVEEKNTPVLLVRGIDSSDRFLQHLEKALKDDGFKDVRYASFGPRFGWSGLRPIGAEIADAARKLKAETNAKKIDVVAFSMGALASRFFIQRLKGKEYVRKFINISGPQNGTYMGYFRFWQQGIRDMLPGSDLINDLKCDKDPFGDVQVYSYYTPYDIIIVPSTSSILKESVEIKSFDVALHHQMVKDPLVLKEILVDLKKPYLAKSAIGVRSAIPAS